MKMLNAKKKNGTQISTSTIWLIGIGILIAGVVGFTIWLQFIHHYAG